MRKIMILTIATIILFLSFVTLIGCHDQKDRELGKIKEQVNVLRLENSQLKKIIARNETCKSGIAGEQYHYSPQCMTV